MVLSICVWDIPELYFFRNMQYFVVIGHRCGEGECVFYM